MSRNGSLTVTMVSSCVATRDGPCLDECYVATTKKMRCCRWGAREGAKEGWGGRVDVADGAWLGVRKGLCFGIGGQEMRPPQKILFAHYLPGSDQ